MNPVPLNGFTCVSLAEHVHDLVAPVSLVCFKLSSSVPVWQRNRETHSKFVNGPL